MRPDSSCDLWQRATPEQAAPGLGPGAAHLWLLSLDTPPLPEPTLAELLDREELARAARFRFEIHRRRFNVAHGLLRWILGHYAGVDPAALRYRLAPHGKPALQLAARSTALEFNLSHSAGWALIGLTHGQPIGVDIELMRDIPERMDLARANFSLDEVRELQQIESDLQPAAFFACWTRKEAYVKALGAGLSVPLHEFDVSVDPRQPARIRRIAASASAAGEWSLLGLQPVEGVWIAAAAKFFTPPWQLYHAGLPSPVLQGVRPAHPGG